MKRHLHLALFLGLSLSFDAAAVSGWNVDTWGMPNLTHDQVYQCPHEMGEGKVLRSWSTTGKRQLRGTCVGGLADGRWTAWHENGRRSSVGAYVEGEKVGTWFYWDAQGTRRKEKYGGTTSSGRCWWPLL